MSFANNITKRLAVAGYIEAEETTLALKALEEEYAGKCYMWPAKTKMGCSKVHMNCKGRDSFLSKIDKRDDKRFVVIGIAFVQPDRLITQKK